MQMTKQQARRCLLAYQGLWPPRARQGKDAILAFIRRVGCIQFDPLNIVGNNPDLVLQSRFAGYTPRKLSELLYEERRLVDGWDKMMAIYPVEDWPYFRRFREDAAKNMGRSAEAIRAALPAVRQAIEEKGPISSLDLKLDHTVDWSWAPTTLGRAVLESMYFWGELIIHHKVHTRRVYDFTHNHLPAELLAAPEPNPRLEDYQDWYFMRRLGAVGLFWIRSGEAWLAIPELKSKERLETLTRLLQRDRVFKVAIDGLDAPLYARSADRAILQAALEEPAPPAQAAVIAPLDNIAWDRRFLKDLFEFDYRWEVYKPVSQRLYGYYVLPVLYGDRFVARFEPGRDKKNKTVVIKNWWWEEGVVLDQALKAALHNCFVEFLSYLGADHLEIEPAAAASGDLSFLPVHPSG
jgi:uncharacterized protein